MLLSINIVFEMFYLMVPSSIFSRSKLNVRELLFFFQDATKQKEHRGSMCHQCLKSDNVGVVICSKCKKKRYCYECIAKW